MHNRCHGTSEGPRLTTRNENASRDDCIKVLLPPQLFFIRTFVQVFCDVADCLREGELSSNNALGQDAQGWGGCDLRTATATFIAFKSYSRVERRALSAGEQLLMARASMQWVALCVHR